MVSEQLPPFTDIFHFQATLPVTIAVKNTVSSGSVTLTKKMAHIHYCIVLFFVWIKRVCQDHESLGNCDLIYRSMLSSFLSVSVTSSSELAEEVTAIIKHSTSNILPIVFRSVNEVLLVWVGFF